VAELLGKRERLGPIAQTRDLRSYQWVCQWVYQLPDVFEVERAGLVLILEVTLGVTAGMTFEQPQAGEPDRADSQWTNSLELPVLRGIWSEAQLQRLGQSTNLQPNHSSIRLNKVQSDKSETVNLRVGQEVV
jgi:hypothetical protein